MLKWFGHMERIKEDLLVKIIVGSGVGGKRFNGRLRMGWMDSVKRGLNERRMCVEQGRMIVSDRSE